MVDHVHSSLSQQHSEIEPAATVPLAVISRLKDAIAAILIDINQFNEQPKQRELLTSTLNKIGFNNIVYSVQGEDQVIVIQLLRQEAYDALKKLEQKANQYVAKHIYQEMQETHDKDSDPYRLIQCAEKFAHASLTNYAQLSVAQENHEQRALFRAKKLTDLVVDLERNNLYLTDFKNSNILMRADGSLGLCDYKSLFALRHYKQLFDYHDGESLVLKVWNAISTPSLSSPEFTSLDINSSITKYTISQAQVYTLGLAWYQLVLGLDDEALVDHHEREAGLSFEATIFKNNPEFSSLIQSMLVRNPHHRPYLSTVQSKIARLLPKEPELILAPPVSAVKKNNPDIFLAFLDEILSPSQAASLTLKFEGSQYPKTDEHAFSRCLLNLTHQANQAKAKVRLYLLLNYLWDSRNTSYQTFRNIADKDTNVDAALNNIFIAHYGKDIVNNVNLIDSSVNITSEYIKNLLGDKSEEFVTLTQQYQAVTDDNFATLALDGSRCIPSGQLHHTLSLGLRQFKVTTLSGEKGVNLEKVESTIYQDKQLEYVQSLIANPDGKYLSVFNCRRIDNSIPALENVAAQPKQIKRPVYNTSEQKAAFFKSSKPINRNLAISGTTASLALLGAAAILHLPAIAVVGIILALAVWAIQLKVVENKGAADSVSNNNQVALNKSSAPQLRI